MSTRQYEHDVPATGLTFVIVGAPIELLAPLSTRIPFPALSWIEFRRTAMPDVLPRMRTPAPPLNAITLAPFGLVAEPRTAPLTSSLPAAGPIRNPSPVLPRFPPVALVPILLPYMNKSSESLISDTSTPEPKLPEI